MSKHKFFWAACIISFCSCVPLIDKAPDTVNPTEDPAIQWQPLGVIDANQDIRAIHATPFEIYFLANSQFFRVDNNRKLLEKRILKTDRDFLGIPVMGDNIIARVIKGLQGNDATPYIEFLLTRNAAAARAINPTKFLDTTKNETFTIDKEPSRTPWCFSADGAKFYITGTVTPGFRPTLLIFDVKLNAQADNFNLSNPISLNKRVEIPNLLASQWESIRYIDNNIYLATKNGGFRVAPDGTVKRLFTHWAFDFFVNGRKIYATGFQPSDFYSSSDDGLTWLREGVTNLQYVETEGDKVFTQSQRGLRFNVADSTLQKVKTVFYNSTFPDSKIGYNDIAFFREHYYINVEKQVFYVKKIGTK